MNAPTTSGKDCSMARPEALRGPRLAYGFGTGSATIAGWKRVAGRDSESGT
jgi:hypothetical protein